MMLPNLHHLGRAFASGLCAFALIGMVVPVGAAAAALEEAPAQDHILPPGDDAASQAQPEAEPQAYLRDAAPAHRKALLHDARHDAHGNLHSNVHSNAHGNARNDARHDASGNT